MVKIGSILMKLKAKVKFLIYIDKKILILYSLYLGDKIFLYLTKGNQKEI